MNEKKQSKFNVRSMVFTAIMAAVICVAAPYSIPLPGLVPVSLATFAVYLAGALLGGKRVRWRLLSTYCWERWDFLSFRVSREDSQSFWA